MFSLFISEFKRYQTAAIILCILQIGLWYILSRMQMILHPSSETQAALVLSSLFGGLLFAMLSIGLHKRKNNWTYLVHRPLAISKIHSALSMAGLTLLFIAFVLPFFAVTIALDLFTDNVVEMRHYLYSVHLFFIAATAYFAGQFLMLHPSKFAFAIVFIFLYLIERNHSPLAYEMTLDAALACLTAYVAHHAFKINLSTYSTKTTIIVISVILLQPAALIGFLMLQAVYFHIPMTIFGLSPLDKKPDGEMPETFLAFVRQDAPTATDQLLARSEDGRTASLARQAAFAEYKPVSRNKVSFADRGGLFMNDKAREFMLVDSTMKTFWVFSHNQMMYVGRDFHQEKVIGYFGPNGFISDLNEVTDANRFEHVPIVVSGQNIQTKKRFFKVDFEQKNIHLIHQLSNEEEYITSINQAFDLSVLLSNQQSYLFNKVRFEDAQTVIEPTHIVPHPTSITEFLSIDITEVSDGFMLLYQGRHLGGVEQPGAALIYQPHEAPHSLLRKHVFSEKLFPELIQNQKFMLSPIVMNIIDDTLTSALKFSFEPPRNKGSLWQRHISSQVLYFMILAALFSAVVTYVLASKIGLPTKTKWLWVVINLICALPGLLTFFLLNSVDRQSFTKKKSTNSALAQGVSPC